DNARCQHDPTPAAGSLQHPPGKDLVHRVGQSGASHRTGNGTRRQGWPRHPGRQDPFALRLLRAEPGRAHARPGDTPRLRQQPPGRQGWCRPAAGAGSRGREGAVPGDEGGARCYAAVGTARGCPCPGPVPTGLKPSRGRHTLPGALSVPSTNSGRSGPGTAGAGRGARRGPTIGAMSTPAPRTIPLQVLPETAPAAPLEAGAKQLGGDKIGRSPVQFAEAPVLRKPSWIRVRIPSGNAVQNLKAKLRENRLVTVCEEASCPNIHECFGHGTATFMILGEVCAR